MIAYIVQTKQGFVEAVFISEGNEPLVNVKELSMRLRKRELSLSVYMPTSPVDELEDYVLEREVDPTV